MDDSRYDVKLNYDPENKTIHQNVVARLERINANAAQRLKQKGSTGLLVLKRGADPETARRLAVHFKNTGARCTVEKISSETTSDEREGLKSSRQASHPDKAIGPERLMTCPNCEKQQPLHPECVACGIIIAKAKERKVSEPAKPVETTSKSAPADPSPPKQQANRKRDFFNMIIQKIQHPLQMEKLTNWANRVADRLIRCAMVFVIAVVLEFGMLFLSKMMWFIYIATGSGQHYVDAFPEKAEMIQRAVDVDALGLGLNTTIMVFFVGVVFGIAAQVLHLIRYLYDSQHLVGKLVIWFVPFIGLNAWIMTHQSPYPGMGHAVFLVTVPALCLLSSCLYLAQTILPEVGEIQKIVAVISENRGETWGRILNRIHKWFDTAKHGQ